MFQWKSIDISTDIYNIRTYTSDDQVIGWTSFDQPESIEQGTKRLEFTYGHHRQRIRQLYRNENGETTKTYAGNCEFVSIDGQQYAYTYLSGPAGLFGIHVKNPDGTSELFYIHTDHLGSLHTITDENGSLLQELSFDAWGSRRNPATWTMFEENTETALFDRGFTGHEHLDGFHLINMNGRLYDPVVSRMLSPDNYVQSPDFSQSFNRYSYCVNNPLKYNDPSGFSFMSWLFGKTSQAAKWTSNSQSSIINSSIDIAQPVAVKLGNAKEINFYFGYKYAYNHVTGNDKESLKTLPGDMLGLFGAHAYNTFWDVDDVQYFDGAILVNRHKSGDGWYGMTVGSFIYGNNLETSIDENSTYDERYGFYMFVHEYGHVLQHKENGFIYFFKYGLPSLADQVFRGSDAHDNFWVETDANTRGYNYFSNPSVTNKTGFRASHFTGKRYGNYPLGATRNATLWDWIFWPLTPAISYSEGYFDFMWNSMYTFHPISNILPTLVLSNF